MSEASPPKPLPKPVQWLLVLIMVGVCGAVLWWVRPSRTPCTVKESFRNLDICTLTGTVKPIDEVNKALNAKSLGSTDLDEVRIEDATGSRSVYFNPAKFTFDGKGTVKVTGREVEERGSGVMRFVVEKVD